MTHSASDKHFQKHRQQVSVIQHAEEINNGDVTVYVSAGTKLLFKPCCSPLWDQEETKALCNGCESSSKIKPASRCKCLVDGEAGLSCDSPIGLLDHLTI